MEVYTPSCGKTTISEARRLVPVEVLAERLTGPGERRGREVYFRCPLHDDTNPSLRVNPETGVWYCDPCGVGGDVIELARLAWGCERREAPMAAAALLNEFGCEIPPRSPSWFRRQERQRPVRDKIEETLISYTQRRIYRWFFKDLADAVEDPDERREEARKLWTDAGELAALIVASRRRNE